MTPIESPANNVIVATFRRPPAVAVSKPGPGSDDPVITAALAFFAENDPEGFFYGFVRPLDETIEGLLEQGAPHSEEIRFLFRQFQFVEAHIETVIKRFEGDVFSFEKTGAVIGILLDSLRSGQPTTFDMANIGGYRRTHRVFTTFEDVYEFFNGLRHFFQGNPEPYLLAMNKLLPPAE